MNRPLIAIGGVTAAALLAAGMTIGGFSSAAAEPGDYSAIPVSPNVITDSTAYTAAAPTINPAYSLARGDQIGSLESGKLANFSIFDCEDYRELAYWFGVQQTHSVYVKGRRAH